MSSGKREIIDGELVCAKCELRKPTNEFYCHAPTKKNKLGFHYWCKDCDLEKHKKYRKSEKGFWANLWNNLNGNAKRRNIKIGIDLDYLKRLYDLQGGVCAVTRIPMQKESGDLSGNVNPYRASVDRIDNSIGYIDGNVRFVCYQVNLMKLNHTEAQLVFWCNAVIKGVNHGINLS